MGHYTIFIYLLTTSVSGRVPGYPSYYPTGTRVINYPDTAAIAMTSPWHLSAFLLHTENSSLWRRDDWRL